MCPCGCVRDGWLDGRVRPNAGAFPAAVLGDAIVSNSRRESGDEATGQADRTVSIAMPGQSSPSISTLSIGAIIWYTKLLQTPSLVQGTYTPSQSRP